MALRRRRELSLYRCTMQLRILTAADVRLCIGMREAIEAMKTAFTQLSSGEAVIPDRVSIASGEGRVSLFMPGYLPREDQLAAKVVSVFGDNPSRGLPVIQGVVLVLDSATGSPVALMDGTHLTGASDRCSERVGDAPSRCTWGVRAHGVWCRAASPNAGGGDPRRAAHSRNPASSLAPRPAPR